MVKRGHYTSKVNSVSWIITFDFTLTELCFELIQRRTMIYADLKWWKLPLHHKDEVKQDKRAVAETSSTEHESAGAIPTYKVSLDTFIM